MSCAAPKLWAVSLFSSSQHKLPTPTLRSWPLPIVVVSVAYVDSGYNPHAPRLVCLPPSPGPLASPSLPCRPALSPMPPRPRPPACSTSSPPPCPDSSISELGIRPTLRRHFMPGLRAPRGRRAHLGPSAWRPIRAAQPPPRPASAADALDRAPRRPRRRPYQCA